ncbi:MAG: 50S ribosomal protein L24 [Desulfuromonas sp.]|nr:MAG: 50S ribosomal protein L24 [Desulfuromonas sp.]
MAVAKLHVKKDDTVMILAGKDKGKTGKVLRVLPEKQRVLVENLNMIKRHTRPTQTNNEGGIIEKEAPVAISNVQLVCSSCNKAARTGQRVLDDGKKVRYCKKCNEIVDK